MGGKPSRGTKADKRLATNKSSARGSSGGGSASPSKPFGGKKAAPFAKGGGRKK